MAAQTLAAAGRSVLVLERARALSNSSLRGDHLHGKRNAVYDSVAGPGRGHPRIAARDDGGEAVVDGDGDAWAYGLNAYAFGGGTRLWQGMAWRFFPEDFRMATVYGNPEGATLADWPIGYDEMEPYYTLAEWELGVAGEEGALTARTPRSKGYPMPAMGTEPARELLAGAAGGWAGPGERSRWRSTASRRRAAPPAYAARPASVTPARWTPRTVRTTRSCRVPWPPGTPTSSSTPRPSGCATARAAPLST